MGMVLPHETQKKIEEALASGMAVASGRPKYALDAHARVVVPMPPSTNNLFFSSGKKRHKGKAYRLWQEKAIPLLAALPTPTDWPVELRILLLPGRKWKMNSDVTNRIKALEDGMVKAGVLLNDSCAYVAGVRVGLAKDRGEGDCLAAVWMVPASEWWIGSGAWDGER